MRLRTRLGLIGLAWIVVPWTWAIVATQARERRRSVEGDDEESTSLPRVGGPGPAVGDPEGGGPSDDDDASEDEASEDEASSGSAAAAAD